MSLALFFGTPEWGHTNPSLPLVAELIQRGDQILYYSLEEFQPAIEQTGATFRSYGDVFPFDYTQWNENGSLVVRQLLQASECILNQFLYTSRLFQPYANAFDETFQFVGPSLSERSIASDFPFAQLSDPSPIYISLGTLFNQQNDFYRQCFQAFADNEHQVILSIGRYSSVEQLGTIPKNFIVRRFVPQLDILQRASLFITHGGMNSASEALYYGVPLLVIPQATDQHYVAKRVEQSGAGLRLDRKKVSSALLSLMATTILTNSHFAQGSKKIGASFRQAGGYMRAADEVQLFKQRYALI